MQFSNNIDRGALTVDEFCHWANIGRTRFYQEVGEHRIKLRKIGRKSVVTMSDAVEWHENLPEAGGRPFYHRPET